MHRGLVSSVAAVSIAIGAAGCSSKGNQAESSANETGAVASNETTEAAAATPDAKMAGDHAIILQLEKVAAIPDAPNDMVSVSDVKFSSGIAGNFITAKVSYGGGCKPHEFKAFWDGSWIKTSPPGIAITLRHNANGDTCKAIVNEMVQINIAGPAAAHKEFFVELTNVPGAAGRVDVKIP